MCICIPESPAIHRMPEQMEASFIGHKSAFLQGPPLDCDIFIPLVLHTRQSVWVSFGSSKKCVYGSANASLYWYKRVRDTICRTGAEYPRWIQQYFTGWIKKAMLTEYLVVIQMISFGEATWTDFTDAVMCRVKDVFIQQEKYGMSKWCVLPSFITETCRVQNLYEANKIVRKVQTDQNRILRLEISKIKGLIKGDVNAHQDAA